MILFSLIFILSFGLESVSYKNFYEKEIFPFVFDIAHICKLVYAEYPYCYEGDEKEYSSYMESLYPQYPNTITVLVFNEQKVVGLGTGIPLSYMSARFLEPWKKEGHDTSSFFYLGELVLLPAIPRTRHW